jgi:hypothetical protein
MITIAATVALATALLGSCVDPDAVQRGGLRANVTLMPRDDAPRRPDFAAFRQRLLVAVARKDADAILMATDPEVAIDFDQTNGLDQLDRLIKDPSQDFWNRFDDLLRQGGTFERADRFLAPYVYSTWPEAIDSVDCVAVSGAGVRLRDRAEPNGRMLATLAFDIVERIHEDVPAFPGWTRVRMANGVEGYIASRFVRSPLEWRAVFELTQSGWKLKALASGGD